MTLVQIFNNSMRQTFGRGLPDVLNTGGNASAAQGDKADSALQLSDLLPYHVGDDMSGVITLDRNNGAVQTISIINNFTINISNGVRGQTLELFINYVANGKTFSRGSTVKCATALSSSFPITLSGWNAYVLTFKFIGGSWVYVGSSGSLPETDHP